MAKTRPLTSSLQKNVSHGERKSLKRLAKKKSININKTWLKSHSIGEMRWLRFQETQAAYNSWLMAFRMEIPPSYDSEDWLVLHALIRPQIKRALRLALQRHQQFSFQLVQQSEFVRPSGDDEITYQHFFQHRMENVLSVNELDTSINQQLIDLDRRIQEFLRNGSGWRHIRVAKVEINLARYRALPGGSYVKLPPYLANKKAIINVQNDDNQCFKWAVLSALFPAAKDPQRVSKYRPHENKVNFEGIEFPATAADVTKFEKRNGLAIFVYHLSDEEKNIQPLRISKLKVPYGKRVRLFYYEGHYMWIKNISALLYDKTAYACKKHFCDYCCSSFTTEVSRDVHEERCGQFNLGQLVKMPTDGGNMLQFRNYSKKLKMPYVIYADFEALNIPDDGTFPSCSKKTQYLTHHEPFSFSYIIIRSDGAIFKLRQYRGEGAAAKFIEWLEKDQEALDQALRNIQPMQMTAGDIQAYNAATKCHICSKPFVTRQNQKYPEKVRDHDHITGAFRGAAHGICNLNYRFSPKLPVFFHNLRGYDSHLIIQGAEREHEIEVIANNLEKYMSFSLKRRLVFKDSMQFLQAGLEKLVSTLGPDDFRFTSSQFTGRKLQLMKQKGFCPYEYLDNWKRLDETQPPPQEAFDNSLRGEKMSAADYKHILNVWQEFGIKNLGEYVDLYLLSDVLLLADVFETFRNKALLTYKLDPAHYLTSPHLAFDALLYTCRDQPPLELLTDLDMHIMFEQGMRGGISVASHRHAEANPKYCYVDGQRFEYAHHDPTKPSSYIVYLDANNLYGWAMKQLLPVGGFQWWTEEEVDKLASENILAWEKEGKKGYVLEVDLCYPQHLHDAHADYPLAPETLTVTKGMLSNFQLDMIEQMMLPFATGQKLAPNLKDKSHYIVHYRNLQFYLEQGLELVKVHRVLEFDQRSWMEAYIDMNTSLRAQTLSEFEKELYKLFNNSTFGKTMENVRKRKDVRFPKDEEQLRKLTASPRFHTQRIFHENLAALELVKTSVTLNKPVYTGFTVLELSKLLMFQFWYECIKPLYADKAKLLYTDTDSLVVWIETEDVYGDMKAHEGWFDFSDYPKDHPCYTTTNKKIPGKMKDEMNGELILEFAAIRSKLYSVLTKSGGKKKAKGIAKHVTKNHLAHQDYLQSIKECRLIECSMRQIRSKKHRLYTMLLQKNALNPLDTKRWICDDGIATLPYGHYATLRDH